MIMVEIYITILSQYISKGKNILIQKTASNKTIVVSPIFNPDLNIKLLNGLNVANVLSGTDSEQNIQASNGVIHIIDNVLDPGFSPNNLDTADPIITGRLTG